MAPREREDAAIADEIRAAGGPKGGSGRGERDTKALSLVRSGSHGPAWSTESPPPSMIRWPCAILKIHMSPTVLRIGSYRFFFFSNERMEPPHIHVQEGRKLAKFWLEAGELAYSKNFAPHELTVVQGLVRQHQDALMEAWHEFFK